MRNRIALVGALVSVVLMVMPAAPVSADHRQRQAELDRLIKEKRSQLAQSEAAETDLITQINASDQRRDALQRRIARLNARMASARAQIVVLETRLDQLQIAMRKKNAEIEETTARLDALILELNSRVALSYMLGPTETQELPGLADIEDMVSSSEYQASLVRNGEALVQEVEAAKEALDEQRAQLEADQVEVEEKRVAAAARAREIAAAQNELFGARAQLDQELAFKRTLLNQVRRQQEEYRRAIQSYVDESASISAFLRGVQSGQNVIAGRGGWLKWPVSGRITSPYGWRTHPVYGHRSFHTGIDIAAPSGTPVKAARYGDVVYTGYKGAYGLVVIIDHGSGIATMYAHLSRVYVRSGEHVSTSESIAAVGSTGWSTGPHLHFEVRAGGEPTNPMKWL